MEYKRRKREIVCIIITIINISLIALKDNYFKHSMSIIRWS